MNEIKRNLIGQMTKIAKENVKFYYEDFTCYDIPSVVEQENLYGVWFVRECGTDLLWDSVMDIDMNMFMTLVSAYAYANTKAFRIKPNGSLCEMSIEDLRD